MISVLTPSHRIEHLWRTQKCLNRQTFKEGFEWIVCSSKKPGLDCRWIPDPKKVNGDFYSLNKAFNALFREAQGELCIMVCDMTWFASDLLEKLWEVHKSSPKVCVRGIGNQYEEFGPSGTPEKLCWVDPMPNGNLVEQIHPNLMEFRVAAVPKQMWTDVGGVDEGYDKVAALSEKEFCIRGGMLDYRFFLDRRIEYRFVRHEDHGQPWNDAYEKGCVLFNEHMEGLKKGTRKPRLGAIWVN